MSPGCEKEIMLRPRFLFKRAPFCSCLHSGGFWILLLLFWLSLLSVFFLAEAVVLTCPVGPAFINLATQLTNASPEGQPGRNTGMYQ